MKLTVTNKQFDLIERALNNLFETVALATEETKKEYTDSLNSSEYDKDFYSRFSDSEVHELIDSLWIDYKLREQDWWVDY